ELEVRALRGDTVARAHDLQLLGEALGHTEDDVVDERAGQAVQGLRLALFVGAADDDGAVLAALDGQGCGHLVGELALVAAHRDGATADCDVGHRGRHCDRSESDAGHKCSPLPLTRCRRGLPHPHPSWLPAGRSGSRRTWTGSPRPGRRGPWAGWWTSRTHA